MPNWCYNTLQVRGKRQSVNMFKARASNYAEKTALSLAKLYPEPDYKKIRVKTTFPSVSKRKYAKKSEAWWDWRVQNWGTKWDVEAGVAYEKEYKNGNKLVVYTFDSAWSPPVEWLHKISADFPDLKFKLSYEEEGMGFKGNTTAIGGQVDDNCYRT